MTAFHNYVFYGEAGILTNHYVEFANNLSKTGLDVAWIGLQTSLETDFKVISSVTACDKLICFNKVLTGVKCNCLCVWETSMGLSKDNLEYADAILCSSTYSRDLIQSRYPFLVGKTTIMGFPIFDRFTGSHFQEHGKITIVTDSIADFENDISRVVKEGYRKKYKRPLEYCYFDGDLSGLDDNYSVIMYSKDVPNSYHGIHQYCSSKGVPVFYPINDFLFDNNFVYRGLPELSDAVCLDDLTREQLSYKTVENTVFPDKNTFSTNFNTIVDLVKKRSNKHIGFHQRLNGGTHVDKIWLHIGTGIGDQLLLGSVIKNFKENNPDTFVGITVKNNDENSKTKGEKVFKQLFGLSPYIDKVNFLEMEKSSNGYGITHKELTDVGIDPEKMFSIDLVPSFLMRTSSTKSALDEVADCLNVPRSYHQEIFTDKKSKEFGEDNSGDIVFCIHGSDVHEGRNTLSLAQVGQMVEGFREKFDKTLTCIGYGNYDVKEIDAIFDKSWYNKTTIREDIELIRNSYLTVSVDTGMAHVAMNLGVKFVGMYHVANFDCWVADYYKESNDCKFLVCAGDDLSEINTNLVCGMAEDLFKVKDEKKKATILITGGRGDQLLAEPAVREFSSEYDVTVVSSHPYLWFGNKSVSDIIYSSAPPQDNLYCHFKGQVFDLTKTSDICHAKEFYAKELGVDAGDINVSLSKDSVKWAKTFVGKHENLVAIHAVTPNVNKMWFRNDPKDLWQELVNKLVNNGYSVVNLGAIPELGLENCLNIDCNKYSEGRQMAILSECKALVSIDSFFAHAAEAIGIKSLVIWGSTSPEVYGHESAIHLHNHSKYDCAPCNRPRYRTLDYSWSNLSNKWEPWQCPHRSCLKTIGVNKVFDLFKNMVVKD